MVTKTFQAETMMEALEMVQKEFGPDAIVLSARTIPTGAAWQVWRQPGVEIISMSPDESKKAGLTPKLSTKPTPVLRAAQNGNGVEFIEEKPEIEWAQPEIEQNLAQKGRTIEEERRSVQPQNTGWQPRHLTRDEVVTLNKTITQPKPSVHPQPVEDDKAGMGIGIKTSSSKSQSAKGVSTTFHKFFERLKRQGVDEQYLEKIKDFSIDVYGHELLENEVKIREFLTGQMLADIRGRSLPNTAVPNRVMILVGSSGSGKTSTMAKLAFFYGHTLNKKVVWICADTLRTGAIVESRSYTDALDIPFELVYTPDELRKKVDEHAAADLILIDTFGFNPFEEIQEVELGGFLSEISDAAIYLVASATTKDVDLEQSANSLKYFGLKGLILSKLDETYCYGNLFNLARKTQLPLTFFTIGKEATGCLQFADTRRLVEALFGKGWHK